MFSIVLFGAMLFKSSGLNCPSVDHHMQSTASTMSVNNKLNRQKKD